MCPLAQFVVKSLTLSANTKKGFPRIICIARGDERHDASAGSAATGSAEAMFGATVTLSFCVRAPSHTHIGERNWPEHRPERSHINVHRPAKVICEKDGKGKKEVNAQGGTILSIVCTFARAGGDLKFTYGGPLGLQQICISTPYQHCRHGSCRSAPAIARGAARVEWKEWGRSGGGVIVIVCSV